MNGACVRLVRVLVAVASQKEKVNQLKAKSKKLMALSVRTLVPIHESCSFTYKMCAMAHDMCSPVTLCIRCLHCALF